MPALIFGSLLFCAGLVGSIGDNDNYLFAIAAFIGLCTALRGTAEVSAQLVVQKLREQQEIEQGAEYAASLNQQNI